MAELGSGNGTSYPSGLDTDNTLEVNSPNAGKTKARAEVINDLNAAVVAIQTELGTDPAGSLADVKTFLQTEHGIDGTHGDITCISITSTGPIEFTVSGNEYIKLPSLTTAQRDALSAANGMIIYNSTLNKFQGYENGSWTNLI